jgi:toxin-antitoxin system PIN domain toxin
MILVDANLLIYAVNRDAHHHRNARRWLEKALSDTETVGLAWIVILAFLRITTRPGILARPLSVEAATAYIDEWLKRPMVELVVPGDAHWSILRNLVLSAGTLGNLTSDAHLAAMALENGADIYSADYDFQRFQGVRHFNPLE